MSNSTVRKARNPYGHHRSRYTGSRVRDYLRRTGRSQAWLSRAMAWHLGHVNDVLLGKAPITVEFVTAVCRVLQLPEEMLFYGPDLLTSELDAQLSEAEHAVAG